MGEITEGVNWLAVWVGTLASVLLGAIWIGPMLFHRQRREKLPQLAIAVQILALFLLAWVVGICETRQAFFEALLVILTVAVALAGHGVMNKKSAMTITCDAGFVVAAGAAMVVAQMIF